MWKYRARLHRPDEGGEGGGAEGGAPAPSPAPAPAPSPAPAPAPSPAPEGGEGTWRADWREHLAGGDDAALKQLQRYASPNDVWKKAKSLESRVSAGELRAVLPKNASAEQLTEWRKQNGIPEKADGYDLGAASGKFSDETKSFLDKALPVLHNAHLNTDQTKAVLKFLNDNVLDTKASRAQADRDAEEAGNEELRGEWGAEFKRNISIIHAVLDKSADPKFKDAVLNARDGETGKPLASDPRWLKMLLGIGLVDNPAGKLVPNAGGNPMKGVEERIAEIESKMGTKAYTNDEKMQAEYRELIDVRDKLKSRG